MPRRIKTELPSREWRKTATARGFTRGSGNSLFYPLKKLLLGIGGWAVCTPSLEPDLDKIVNSGRRFPGKSKMLKGLPCSCHQNSAIAWSTDKDKSRICTGYALTRDGMWRQHSWVTLASGELVETTVKRVQYFGYELTPAECEFFLEANL
jgi:hypothetical protein